MTVLIDKRGWRYAVLTWPGESKWKARYNKPLQKGWHGVREMQYRNTQVEAEMDMEAYAFRKKMKKTECSICITDWGQ